MSCQVILLFMSCDDHACSNMKRSKFLLFNIFVICDNIKLLFFFILYQIASGITMIQAFVFIFFLGS